MFYWDHERKILYPKNEKLNECDEFVLVDSNVTTGTTLRKAILELGLSREKTKIRANPKTELAKKLIHEIVPNGDPDPEKVMIAFAGKAASLKSFIAKGLEMTQGIPVIQIGEKLKNIIDVGRYGEKLAQLEENNPFIVGEILYPFVKQHTERTIILDGVKSIETAIFLSYSTKRPMYVFFVEADEELRSKAVALRMDQDDVYTKERDQLFEEGLTRLKEKAYAVINMGDWKSLQSLCELLELLGFRTRRILDIPNPFNSKVPLLELYRRNVEKLIKKSTMIEEKFSEYLFHKSYLERLKRQGISLTSKQEEVIMLTASAFRIVDDILDENTIRDGKPAFWRVHGITKSIYLATLMTVKAWNITEQLGVGKEFLEMFRRVIEAVRYELDVEDGKEKFENFDNWLRAAEREAAFREFLAILSGHPEKVPEFKAWALRAQAKDDLLGGSKGGREDTERKLKRPLFREEWLPLLPTKP